MVQQGTKQAPESSNQIEQQYAETLKKIKRHLDGINKLVQSLEKP